MSKLTPVLAEDEIRLLVENLARRISVDYQGRELILVAVLKGAFVFLSDLARKLSLKVKIDFLQAASYGSGTASSGVVRLAKDIGIDLRGRDVLLVEDIVDTGATLRRILDHLGSFQPRSLEVCALIDKRERRETDVAIAYVGQVVPQGFLVGYGLDYAEDYRQLPAIYRLEL
jgi:hypoxanthine phosphoribosyltransferase